jgi:acyl-CoA thioester hydrolase
MKSDFKFHYTLRVRFAETDLQGVVFNPNYLMYCDVAWTEYFRALGITYNDILATGVDSVIKRATVEFESSARFDDVLNLHARVSAIGKTSLSFDFEIRVDEEDRVVATVSSVYVFVNPETNRPTSIPENLRVKISAFEHKDPSVA